jgi:hypothetical protein
MARSLLDKNELAKPKFLEQVRTILRTRQVKDVDIRYLQITLRHAKGGKAATGKQFPPSPDLQGGGGEPLVQIAANFGCRGWWPERLSKNRRLTDYVTDVTVMQLTLLK